MPPPPPQGTRPSAATSGADGRPRALRLWAAAAIVLAVGYMAVLALHLLVNIGPYSATLSRNSAAMAEAMGALERRTEANHRVLAGIRSILEAGVEQRGEDAGAGRRLLDQAPAEWFAPLQLPLELRAGADSVASGEVLLRDALEALVDAVDGGDRDEALQRLAAADQALESLQDALVRFQVQGLGHLAAQEALLAETATRAGRAALLWLAGGILVLGLGSAVIHLRVGVPLRQLDRALRKVEEGDLAAEVEPAGRDEVGALVRRFNAMTRELRERAREDERARTGLASRLERLLEHAAVEVLVLDAESLRIREVNRQAVRNLGYSREAILEMSPADLLTADSAERGLPLLEGLRTGTSSAATLGAELVRADGSTYPVESRILYAPHDAPPSFLVLSQDLSGRVREEEGLRRARSDADRALRRLRSLVENSPLGVVEWDPGLQVREWDGEAARILGLPRDQALGRSPGELEFLAPEDREQVARRLQALLTGEAASEVLALSAHTPAGRRETVWYSSAVRDGQGRPEAILALVDDVTAESGALEELRTSEERYRILFERNPLPMWAFHRDNLRFLAVNDAAVRHYGYSREEFLGMTAEAIRPPEEVARFHAEREVITPGLRGAGIWTHRRKDGTLLQAEITRYGFELDGVPVVLVLAQDVTERLISEAEVRRSREELLTFTGYLQTIREEERTRLAREIHDELGQALTGVRMGLARVTSRLRAEEVEAAAAVVEETAELVDGSIQEVRRIATQLRPGVLDQLGLPAAIEWLADDLRTRSGVEVQVELPNRDPRLSPEAQTQLFRCAQEALTNVVRHASARRVEVAVRSDPDGVRLVVQDDGRGFDPEGVSGRSLGLVGMRERARLVGGGLRLESVPGRGTRVTVTLPPEEVAPGEEEG